MARVFDAMSMSDWTDFDADYYYDAHRDTHGDFGFGDWWGKSENIHWGDYMQTNPGLTAAYGRGEILKGSPDWEERQKNRYNPNLTAPSHLNPNTWQMSEWDYGYHHYDLYGKSANKERWTPKVVGPGGGDTNNYMTIQGATTKGGGYEDVRDQFGAWHYDTFGRAAGLQGWDTALDDDDGGAGTGDSDVDTTIEETGGDVSGYTFEYEDIAGEVEDTISEVIGKVGSGSWHDYLDLSNADSAINTAIAGKFNEFLTKELGKDTFSIDISDIVKDGQGIDVVTSTDLQDYVTGTDLGNYVTGTDLSGLGYQTAGDVKGAIGDSLSSTAEGSLGEAISGFQTKEQVAGAIGSSLSSTDEGSIGSAISGFQSLEDVQEEILGQLTSTAEGSIGSAISGATSGLATTEDLGDYTTTEGLKNVLTNQGFALSTDITDHTAELSGLQTGQSAIKDFIGSNLTKYEDGLDTLIANTKKELTTSFGSEINTAITNLSGQTAIDIGNVKKDVKTSLDAMASTLSGISTAQEGYITASALHQANVLKIQEDMAKAAGRVRTLTTTGVGGAASFRGSRAAFKDRGRVRKGVKQFSRKALKAGKTGLKI